MTAQQVALPCSRSQATNVAILCTAMLQMDQTTYDLVKQTTETAQHHFPAWQTAMYRSVIGKPVVTAGEGNGKSDGMVD